MIAIDRDHWEAEEIVQGTGGMYYYFTEEGRVGPFQDYREAQESYDRYYKQNIIREEHD